MKELRTVIAKNIQALRTESGLTQLELAEYLNYTDKAVSKWERAEAIPDVTVLKQIADRFGVSVDYLLEEEHAVSVSDSRQRKIVSKNRFIISLVSVIGVFALATVLFSLLLILEIEGAWTAFVYAMPVSSIVALVLSGVWGRRVFNLAIISVLIWSLIFTVYITLLVYFEMNWWALFLVGIPAQIILLMLSGMNAVINRKEKVGNGTDTSDAAYAEKAD